MIRVLQGLSIAILALLLLECSARGYMTLREDIRPSENQWYAFSEELGWERRPNFNGYVAGMQMPVEAGSYKRKFDSQGFFMADSEQISASHDSKILVLGDSTTFGWGIPPESSYAEVLDDMLPHASVINLGVNGYTSYQGYKTLLRYLPTLQPAMIIISFNFNDRRYVLSADAMDSDAKFHQDVSNRRLEPLRLKVYLYRFLRVLMSKARLIHVANNAEHHSVDDLRKLTVRVPPESYRENLVKIAQLGKEKNIPVVFLVLKDNPIQGEHLSRGLDLLERAQYDRGIQELKIVVNLNNPSSDLARKYLAIAYEKQGAFGEAKKVVGLRNPLVSLHGGYPLYRDAEYNEIMRSVAKEYDMKLVEAGQALDEDPSMYLDNCHPDERGHRKIANLLYAAVNEVVAKGEGVGQEKILSAKRNRVVEQQP